MPEDRQSVNNALSISSSASIEGKLKIEEGNGDDGSSSPYPDRPGEPDCIYYLRTGSCGYGSNCRFNHPPHASQVAEFRGELPQRVGQPDCGYYLKTGTCKYGSTCKYHHPQDRHGAEQISFNVLGLPMRQEEKSCPHYLRTGLCKFGAACRFHHPEPASHGAAIPPNSSPAYGPAGPFLSGLHYASGRPPTWSLLRVPSLSNPRVQGPQPYMPVVISPQGMVPAQGWNTFLGTPVSSASILGSNVAYNPKLQVESGSSGQVHLYSASLPDLPERPDQPECRYFIQTGSCKYGSDCKFHHPKDKFAQMAVNTLGPLGLPLRPGQAVCSYYSTYGLCNYGATCKFDHPLSGCSYNYSLSLPLVSMLNPLFPYPRSSQLVSSSESSPSKSSKNPSWIQKPEAVKHKCHNPNSSAPEASPERVASPNPVATSSELPCDQSE
ncbi:Zinc finger, CCCH-type [Dillenia turbinata]|uniref:Zinc finger, CCCH-type n=1 Tax=Dillenia turbinata TaxID=194707 RepID=A0AAN8UW96_9MAGN